MAISASVTVGGVVRAVWDDAAETYTEFGPDGTTVTLGPRAYTAVELAQKADRAARTTILVNSVTLRAQLEAGIAALTTDVTTLNGSPTNAQLIGILRRCVKATLGLMRMVSGQLGSADTGV